jgi:hypothetical protein
MAQALRKQNTPLKEYTPKQKMKAKSIINGDHPNFARKVLKVYNKAGELVPFIHNKAQREFNKVWDECLRRFGYVRIISVKARRHGISTAVAGRFYHNIIKADARGKKCNALVVAQDDDSSTALFDITKAYQLNAGDFAPRLSSISAHRLDTAYSTYLCMTAGQQPEEKGKGKGRGMTAQQIHLSEVAHIKNAQVLASSLLLTIGQEIGTAAVLESTANGEGDYFHQQYLAAKRGETDFLPFFAPWFWDDANQCEPPVGFKLDKEDMEYQKKYDLSMRQMAWRRMMEYKLSLTIEQGKLMFKQEFPADDEEAFSFSATESYIPSDLVKAAMDRPPERSYGAIVGGYDPTRKGNDRDAWMLKQGANIWGLETPSFGDDTAKRVQFLKDKLDATNPYIDMIFMDSGGGGIEILSWLNNDGYCDDGRIKLIDFGAGATKDKEYPLMRDQMAGEFKKLLLDKHRPLSIDVKGREMEYIIDVTATGYEDDIHGRPKMESKKSIKKRLKISTDLFDASILTVAEPVKRQHVMGGQVEYVDTGDDLYAI